MFVNCCHSSFILKNNPLGKKFLLKLLFLFYFPPQGIFSRVLHKEKRTHSLYKVVVGWWEPTSAVWNPPPPPLWNCLHKINGPCHFPVSKTDCARHGTRINKILFCKSAPPASPSTYHMEGKKNMRKGREVLIMAVLADGRMEAGAVSNDN